HQRAALLAKQLRRSGFEVSPEPFFDTLRIELGTGARRRKVLEAAEQAGVNVRSYGESTIVLSVDETTTINDLRELVSLFTGRSADDFPSSESITDQEEQFPAPLRRESPF